MMNNESHIKRKSRTLSRFLCQEMMYDFVTEQLDEDRKQAMIDFVHKSEETQEDLDAFQEAISYCEQLTQLTPTEPLLDKIKSQSSISKKLISIFSWGNWPQPLKWSLQGVLVSLLAASFAIFIPWEKFQIDLDLKSKGSPLYVEEKQKSSDTKPLVVSQNDNASEKQLSDTIEAFPLKNIDSTEEVMSKNDEVSEVLESADVEIDKSEVTNSENQVVAKADSQNSIREEDKEATNARSAVVKSNLKGSLTRMYMTVKDFKEFSLVVENFIRSVGGQKAGQVDLGWEKNKNTRYFHFTIPEKDYADLMQLLRAKADTRVMRTPHSRVMSEGKMRLILEISSDD